MLRKKGLSVLMAANRVGKTVASAIETTCHLILQKQRSRSLLPPPRQVTFTYSSAAQPPLVGVSQAESRFAA